jgi:hypothetical protein
MIELATGQAVAPDEGGTASYPVRVEDGLVMLRLDAMIAPCGARSATAEAAP